MFSALSISLFGWMFVCFALGWFFIILQFSRFYGAKEFKQRDDDDAEDHAQ